MLGALDISKNKDTRDQQKASEGLVMKLKERISTPIAESWRTTADKFVLQIKRHKSRPENLWCGSLCKLLEFIFRVETEAHSSLFTAFQISQQRWLTSTSGSLTRHCLGNGLDHQGTDYCFGTEKTNLDCQQQLLPKP